MVDLTSIKRRDFRDGIPTIKQKGGTACVGLFLRRSFSGHSVSLHSQVPASLVVAHEGHKMECNETSVNAMKADIQAMPTGEAKTTAMRRCKWPNR